MMHDLVSDHDGDNRLMMFLGKTNSSMGESSFGQRMSPGFLARVLSAPLAPPTWFRQVNKNGPAMWNLSSAQKLEYLLLCWQNSDLF